MKLWEEIMINQGKRNKIQSNLSNFTKELEENKELLNSLMVNKQQYERRVKLIRKNLNKVI